MFQVERVFFFFFFFRTARRRFRSLRALRGGLDEALERFGFARNRRARSLVRFVFVFVRSARVVFVRGARVVDGGAQPARLEVFAFSHTRREQREHHHGVVLVALRGGVARPRVVGREDVPRRRVLDTRRYEAQRGHFGVSEAHEIAQSLDVRPDAGRAGEAHRFVPVRAESQEQSAQPAAGARAEAGQEHRAELRGRARAALQRQTRESLGRAEQVLPLRARAGEQHGGTDAVRLGAEYQARPGLRRGVGVGHRRRPPPPPPSPPPEMTSEHLIRSSFVGTSFSLFTAVVPETFAPPFTSPRASARVVDMGDDFYVRYYVVRVSSARARPAAPRRVPAPASTSPHATRTSNLTRSSIRPRLRRLSRSASRLFSRRRRTETRRVTRASSATSSWSSSFARTASSGTRTTPTTSTTR